MPYLKPIYRLECIDAHLLTDLMYIHGRGVLLRYKRDFELLPLADLADCQIEEAVDAKTPVFTHTLTARLCCPFDVRCRNLCYRLTTVDGCQYLLGAFDAPYPVSLTSFSMPGVVTDYSGCSLRVTYLDTLGVMPILD